MVERFIFIFLATTLLILSGGVDAKAKARKRLSEVNQKLKLLNKPAVRSIKSEDGDIIDCVDIYKQPAFDHPALRNHTIQMRPSFILPYESSHLPAPSQTWQKSGSCPEGSVPIRRVGRQELLRAASLEHFGRDGLPTSLQAVNTTSDHRFVYYNASKISMLPAADHSSAFLITTGYNFLGARGDINIWSPSVESSDEYTTAQIWLKNGVGDIESLEAGWMVNPNLFGDARPRLFGRWTLDAYQTTGCINHICSGFIQTSLNVALGGALQPFTQRGGPLYHMSIRIEHDPSTGSWWLLYGDEIVGYWPGSILNYMQQSATKVQCGGDVYSKNVMTSSNHTATAMGSGGFANGLWGVASFINNLRIVDTSLQLKYPQWVFEFSEEPNCYTTNNYRENPADEPTFYFGGPGRNPNCP